MPLPRSAGLFAPRDLGSRDNALNLLRLVLAFLVFYSHADILAGTGDGYEVAGQHLGSWGVVGFFAISGFLITGSRMRADAGPYLINRVTRIFPGFLFSLVFVAFVMAPAAHVIEKGTIDGFFGASPTPGSYVYSNILLHISTYNIGTTLASVPYPGAWNGSLWSLYYEFWCYIIIGVFLSWNFIRSHVWPTALLFLVSVAMHAGINRIGPYVDGNSEFALLIFMLPYFLGGALMYQLRERIPMRPWIALASTSGAVALILVLPSFGAQLASPLIAYVVLWLGAVLPSPEIIKVHDISYGVYIYHFPVLQLLILLGMHRHGLPLLLLAAGLVTIILSVASWLGIERAAMRWSRGRRPWGDLRQQAR